MFFTLLVYQRAIGGLLFWSICFGLITPLKLPFKWSISAFVIYIVCSGVIILDILPLPVYG